MDEPHPESFAAWRLEKDKPARPALRRGMPELPYDRTTIVKMYFTYAETAALCFRTVDRIKHLTIKHNLTRVLIEPERNEKGKKGRPARKLALLPAETVNRLRQLTIGL